ncbi:cap-specific mRNA (nucleoside-2'-O-)-methyltransferase 1-like [Sabethes cyaneus]|uniref:cap-specific mRNA (nucleoside-2'-O-)-methyltransferase 1-like n=1 Tax=Sabethes cyaneus TaxID=53552 RepID=UPI00237E95D1|nr:cap-specific mRNA (nucleoside-2'-O-)-methyltransferase 1-like [Sabethes cyaneus]
MLTADRVLMRVAEAESKHHVLEYDPLWPKVKIDPDTWIQIGPRKDTIADETNYCKPELLQKLLRMKSSLDNVHFRQVRMAGKQVNPFEVNNGQFMNRAAVKIASIDAMFDWTLCQLLNGDTVDLFYFVDIFGGPGGCSEYVLWRNGGWNARGFGFTTKGDYEFLPEMFRAGCPETLDAFYGPNDSGNIFDPSNMRGFIDYVKAQTDDLGVHLVMCDGGFYVKNNHQEVISKQLYLCIILLAISLNRPGGQAILKVFDLYTPFSVGLVYALSQSYGKVSIVKPVTSRPANSERYLVCQNRLNDDQTFGDYLYSINRVLWEQKHAGYDIQHIISPQILEQNSVFCDFIRNSNNEFASKQTQGLKMLLSAVSQTHKLESVNRELLQSTLWRLWKLDHKCLSLAANDKNKSASDYAGQFIDASTLKLLKLLDTVICDRKALREHFRDPQEWSFLPLDVTVEQGKSIRTMFLSKGNGNVFYFDRKDEEWRQYKEYQLILSPQTLLYGEIVEEISVKDNTQKLIIALHIIDAIFLGGIDVRSFPLSKRNAMCSKFAKALNRPLASKSNSIVRSIPVRCKQPLPMASLDAFFNNISINQLPNGTKVLGCEIDSFDPAETKRFYIPRGLLFIRHSQAKPLKSVQTDLEFDKSFVSRHLWPWSKTSQIYSSSQCFDIAREDNLVYRVDFDELLEEFDD